VISFNPVKIKKNEETIFIGKLMYLGINNLKQSYIFKIGLFKNVNFNKNILKIVVHNY